MARELMTVKKMMLTINQLQRRLAAATPRTAPCVRSCWQPMQLLSRGLGALLMHQLQAECRHATRQRRGGRTPGQHRAR